ncbi:MAG: hypothetical protein M0T80_01215 [Actinomycetota bacterium]|nr:hypothetical protein [Actinomycetota bacterium]
MPCSAVPKIFIPDPGFGLLASSPPTYGCSNADVEFFIMGASTSQARSAGALLESEAMSCPSLSAANSAYAQLLSSSTNSGSSGGPGSGIDTAAPHLGDRSAVILSPGVSHDAGSVQVRSGTSLVTTMVIVATDLGENLPQELSSPALLVALGSAQLRQLDRVGPARSSPPPPELAGMNRLGVQGCPSEWSSEAVLPCADVPRAFSVDPTTGVSTASSGSGAPTEGLGALAGAAQDAGCENISADGFLLGSSILQLSSSHSEGAIILSMAASCSSVADADNAFNGIVHASEPSSGNGSSGSAASGPLPDVPRIGGRSIVLAGSSPGVGTRALEAVVVSGTSVLTVLVGAGYGLPAKDLAILNSVTELVRLARDQLRQLERVEPPGVGGSS